MSKIILASTSPYRKQLLQRILQDFLCIAPNTPESRHSDEAPLDLAVRLAKEKARSVATEYSEAVIIGSDQVACLGQTIYGKPMTRERAQEQLSQISGNLVQFITAVCVIDPKTKIEHEFMDITEVQFLKLTPETIARYLSLEDALNCAGAFKSEGLGISLIQSMKCSDPTGLVGLPLIGLCGVLREVGVL